MLIDLSCPVENRGVTFSTNPETGEPCVSLKLLNISEKIITSLNFNLKVYNENDSELTSIPVEFLELSAEPKEFFAEDELISIADCNDAKKIVVEVTHATFKDEEPYLPSDENTVDYDEKEASIEDALLLRQLVSDAVCFASEKEDHWRCTCGRPNFLDSENCVRCGRNKDVMLQNFSSIETLNNALKLREQEEEQKASELEKAREEKKKKIKKNLITTAIVILSLLVLTVAGYFVRYAVCSIQAGNAIKNNDYLKAYELYSKVNNKKKYTIVDKVMGNTPSNLVYGTGYLAEDSENLYYITQDMFSQPANLVKENKSTKEKTILTDAAHSNLNVVGDYIYFINTDGLPCRMTKDGKTTDILMETQTYYICVVSNDMYFIKRDYDNPKGFTQEECEILAAQGQIDTFVRLYKLNLITKEETMVSTENITSCSIYGNRIYYLTTNEVENTWAMSNLKSMDMNGKDIKSLVDVPVTSFFVKDNALYYISYFNEILKGNTISDMSALDCKIFKLDLESGEKTAVLANDDDIVMDINVSGDKMVYIAYNRSEFLNYYVTQAEDASIPTCEIKTFDFKTNETKSILTADVLSMNVCGNEIFCMQSINGMTRLTLDGGKFEPVYEDGTNELAVTEEANESSNSIVAAN